MTIRSSREFEVVRTTGVPDQTPKMTLRHAPTGKTLETTGAVLEAEFSSGDKRLLLITEDVPCEEALHVLLLDENLNQLGALELSAPYTPGLPGNLAIARDGQLRFSFFSGDETWCLRVSETPYIEIWANKHPVRKKSPLLRKSWLVLERIQGNQLNPMK